MLYTPRPSFLVIWAQRYVRNWREKLATAYAALDVTALPILLAQLEAAPLTDPVHNLLK